MIKLQDKRFSLSILFSNPHFVLKKLSIQERENLARFWQQGRKVRKGKGWLHIMHTKHMTHRMHRGTGILCTLHRARVTRTQTHPTYAVCSKVRLYIQWKRCSLQNIETHCILHFVGVPSPSKVWVAPVQIFGRRQSTFQMGKDHSTAGWIASMVESWFSWKIADLNSPTVPWIFFSSVSFHSNCERIILIRPILLFWSLS